MEDLSTYQPPAMIGTYIILLVLMFTGPSETLTMVVGFVTTVVLLLVFNQFNQLPRILRASAALVAAILSRIINGPRP